MVLRRTVRRDQLVKLVAGLSPCLIGMEACSGAHEWGRRFQELGHRVRLMAPKFVVPYRKSGKNDGNDAEAICEAVTRPEHAFCTGEVARAAGAAGDAPGAAGVRGGEDGHHQPAAGADVGVRRRASSSLDHGAPPGAAAAENLPELARRAIGDLLDQLRVLDERIHGYDREIEAQAKLCEPAQRLMKIRGIGPTTALPSSPPWATHAEFKNGRQFAAWIGLVRVNTPPAARPAWATSAARRCLPQEPARAGRAFSAAHRGDASRPRLTLGARTAAAPRLLPDSGRNRQQERAHRLGAAREERILAHGLNTTASTTAIDDDESG